MEEHNCTLVNFGESLRVLYDKDQRHVKIPPGSVKKANLDPATIKFIHNAMATDPLCVFANDIELSDDIRECLDIMSVVSTAEYDTVLQRTATLIGNNALGKTKPSRGEIAGLLKGVIEKFQKVTIREQVPTRDDPRRTPSEQRPEAPDRSKPDNEPKPNAAPGAVQSGYQPTMAAADDPSDGVLAIAVEPPKAKEEPKAKAAPKAPKGPRINKRPRVRI